MPSARFDGVAFIGDPHVSSRAVGFRKDDFGRAVLGKISWCLDFASSRNLLPVFLGDLFNHPRDNANWLLGELMELLSRHNAYGVYGNHDCHEDVLGENDSLDVLVRAGHYRLLGSENPLSVQVCGKKVAIYGASWGQRIPTSFPRHPDSEFGILVSHHDVRLPGYEEVGRFSPFEIEGIGLVVNGHVHSRLADREIGATRWSNPGNVSRTRRSDATRAFVPSIMILTNDGTNWETRHEDVPHRQYDEVFHEAIADGDIPIDESAFVRGLAELQARRSESGAGLIEFLRKNLGSFEPEIGAEIESLAVEVLDDKMTVGDI